MRPLHDRSGWPKPGIALLAFVTLWAPTLFLNAKAQTTSPSAQAETQRWRNANNDVGRYARGHIDLLKAERGRTTGDPSLSIGAFKEDPAAPELTEDAARKAVLALHADLVAEQAISGLEKFARNTQLLTLQQATQKLWIEAVAAKEQLNIQRKIAEAASVSLELARRMEKIGNWGKTASLKLKSGTNPRVTNFYWRTKPPLTADKSFLR